MMILNDVQAEIHRMLILVPFCQESPRWLIVKGRREEALKALNKIRPEHDVVNGLTAAEVEAIAVAVDDAGARGSGTMA